VWKLFQTFSEGINKQSVNSQLDSKQIKTSFCSTSSVV
jgi:hypothetical protein